MAMLYLTPVMNIASWTKNTVSMLTKAGLPTPVLDAEVLLADLLEKDRSWIHANPELTLAAKQLKLLDTQIKRRIKHEPIAYIRGKQEFYGRDFWVTPETLTPRPETETMVEIALELIKNQDIDTIADVGTGSGCIVISIELESNRKLDFSGYDISRKALVTANKNAERYNSKAKFVLNDLRSKDKSPWQKADLIVANLPYVPESFKINLAASHEPRLAIFGGKDGLDYYRTLFKNLKSTVKHVLTESLPPQHETLTGIAKKEGFKLVQTQDLIQQFKR